MKTSPVGQRIGCWALLLALGIGAQQLLSRGNLRSWLPGSSGPTQSPAPAEGNSPEDQKLLQDEQQRLLDEHRQTARDEALRLHEERMELRRERIGLLAEKWQRGGSKSFDSIELKNTCRHTLNVVLYYMDLDDQWIRRGWWEVKPGDTVSTDAMTRNAYVYFYAENLAEKVVLDGAGLEGALEMAVVDAKFDQLDGEAFLYPNSRNVWLYQRKTGNTWQDYLEELKCYLEAPPSRTPKPLPAEAPPGG